MVLAVRWMDSRGVTTRFRAATRALRNLPTALIARLIQCRAFGPPSTTSCLFAQACAQHVKEVARTEGLKAAITAARCRRQICHPDFELVVGDHTWWVRCRDGSTHTASMLSSTTIGEAAVAEYLLQLAHLDDDERHQ